MAIHFDNLEALKQVFKEQEENEQAQENQENIVETNSIKVERLKLDQRKQRHREQQDREKLKLLQEREQRARANECQQFEQIRRDVKIYLFSLLATFGSILISAILLLVIILKY